MSEHRVTVSWERGACDFTYEAYSRDHTWQFENGISINASATPAYRGNPDCVDPEEAFVASLSSCHMLTFLAIAAKKRFVVDRYTDRAIGYLQRNDDGRLAVTQVTLHPDVTFNTDRRPSPDELTELHDLAHRHCFIANSVKTSVSVDLAQHSRGAV
ncbi:MAG: OsmC family protein [Planctomycetota bacterium]|jgi:organic hydroperoxide reductase OsmC/OhrA